MFWEDLFGDVWGTRLWGCNPIHWNNVLPGFCRVTKWPWKWRKMGVLYPTSRYIKWFITENIKCAIYFGSASHFARSQNQFPNMRNCLGFTEGVFHVECKYTSHGPQLIEVNAPRWRLPVEVRWIYPVKSKSLLTIGCVWKCCVPLNPMVLLIIIPIKWLFHWEYTLFSDKPNWYWKIQIDSDWWMVKFAGRPSPFPFDQAIYPLSLDRWLCRTTQKELGELCARTTEGIDIRRPYFNHSFCAGTVKSIWVCLKIGYIPNEIAIFHRDNDQQNHWV